MPLLTGGRDACKPACAAPDTTGIVESRRSSDASVISMVTEGTCALDEVALTRAMPLPLTSLLRASRFLRPPRRAEALPRGALRLLPLRAVAAAWA